jgi:hypothetical protein
MPNARVFVPQEALESWLTEGRALLVRDTLTVEDQLFHVTGAVRFVAEVAGGGDELGLVGRVKSREQLAVLGAEHSGESVLLRDNAYHVVEGYLLSPVVEGKLDLYPRILSLFARP